MRGAVSAFRPFSSSSTRFDEFDEDNNDTSSRPRTFEKCINNVTLLGRVGATPIVRGTSERPVVAFSLATNLRYTPGGAESGNESVVKTEWHNVAVFKPYLRDVVANNVYKGQRVLVEGRIQYGSVEDQSGNIRHTTSIVANDVIRFAA